jgi:predicted Zn-dependent protease
MTAALARTGAITPAEAQTRRDAWAKGLEQQIGALYRPMIWAQTDATPARTPDEARAAVARMPANPPPYYYFTRVYGDVGRTLQLAGKNEQALPYLERVTRRCVERDPIDFDYLGRAQEGLGNTAAACEAYATVVRRWGNAKPRSLSAEHARERHTALSCDSIGG